MSVVLHGSSPRALVSAILLMSRARQFGTRLDVQILGDPSEMAHLHGPAMLSSPILATCGVGRRCGSGSLVVVSGPADAPLALSLSENGLGQWFEVDRSGRGHGSGSQALVSLLRDSNRQLRDLARSVLGALQALGIAVETAVLDLLLSAPVSATERAYLALRASKGLGAGGNTSLSAWLQGSGGWSGLSDPPSDPARLMESLGAGELDLLLGRLSPHHRIRLRNWLDEALKLVPSDPRVSTLVSTLTESLGPLLALPLGGLVGPPDPAGEVVARGFELGLGAIGEGRGGEAGLADTFRLFGGRFVNEARHPIELPGAPPPEGRLERWHWFCTEAAAAAEGADRLWRQVIDPVQ